MVKKGKDEGRTEERAEREEKVEHKGSGMRWGVEVSKRQGETEGKGKWRCSPSCLPVIQSLSTRALIFFTSRP